MPANEDNKENYLISSRVHSDCFGCAYPVLKVLYGGDRTLVTPECEVNLGR